MSVTLHSGSTVLFAGDSITDCRRQETEEGLGTGYPLHIAAQWGLRHPDRPVRWLNTAVGGHRVADLAARWHAEVLAVRPDVVSILVGINDVGWQKLSPQGREIPAAEFEAGYDGLLASLVAMGTRVILIEPFLLPIRGVVAAGGGRVLIGERERAEWRVDLDPKIQVARGAGPAVRGRAGGGGWDVRGGGFAGRGGALVDGWGASDAGRACGDRQGLAAAGGMRVAADGFHRLVGSLHPGTAEIEFAGGGGQPQTRAARRHRVR